MTKTKVALFSVIIAAVYVVYNLLQPPYQGEGFGEIANGLRDILFGFILIPFVFGVLGFIYTKEKRFIQAISSFGISFVIILAFMLSLGAWKNVQREKLHPQAEIQTLPSDGPQRKMPLPPQHQ